MSRLSRSAREGTTSFLDVIFILGILVLLQYLAFSHPKEWDLTAGKQFSLTDLSRKVLSSLNQNLDLWVFISRGDQQTRDLAHEYEVSSRRVKVHYVDPDAEPIKAREFGITSAPPVIVAIYGKNREQVLQPDENKLTNAINRLVSGGSRSVYFLSGEGEPSMDSPDQTGYSHLRDALRQENFEVSDLSLVKEKTIPKTASAIVIIDPRYSFLPPVKKELTAYLKKGGRILFLCGLGTSKDGMQFLGALGISPQNDLVTDRSMTILGAGPEYLVVNTYGNHPITQPFTQSRTPTPVILPLARTLQTGKMPKEESAAPLITTSPSGASFSLSITGRKALINFKKPEARGIIPVAYALTFPGNGRLVVVGSSFFADNQWLPQSANQDFALNAVSWLCESPNTIAISHAQAHSKPLLLDQRSALQLYFLSLIAIPAFGIVLGISNWLRRRSL